VKDEISRIERPDDFTELIESAIRINNRYYERNIEQKGYQTREHFRKP
jgi:hypothetical protein